MKEVKIIGISGYIGSGKDEVAKLAVKQFGYKHFMLSGLAKSVLSQVHGISLEQLEDRKYKEQYRPLVIQYAEKLKEVDLYVHCKYVYELIKTDLDNCGSEKYVVSGLRFPYESSFFRTISRCSKTKCEVSHRELPGYDVTFKSIYIESDLADKSSKDPSESYYESYFSKNNDGIIFNGTQERYESRKDKVNFRLVNQLIKFL